MTAAELRRIEERPRRNISHVPSPRADGRLVVAETTHDALAVALARTELARRKTGR